MGDGAAEEMGEVRGEPPRNLVTAMGEARGEPPWSLAMEEERGEPPWRGAQLRG